jgi:hypothetical protein
MTSIKPIPKLKSMEQNQTVRKRFLKNILKENSRANIKIHDWIDKEIELAYDITEFSALI